MTVQNDSQYPVLTGLINKVQDLFDDALALSTQGADLKLVEVEAQTKDIVTHNLSPYCDDATRSEEFRLFMTSLDDSPKVLLIPRGKVLRLNKYFDIPSNTTFHGGEIVFEGIVTVNALWNESLIANEPDSKNIIFSNVKIVYNLSNTGKSLFRFSKCDRIIFEKCLININGDGTQNHNAMIDFWKGCTNVVIKECVFNADNQGSTAGGCIWIKNSIVSGYDTSSMTSSNFIITGNTFISNCGDEMIAVFSSGDNMDNVKISKNTFVRKQGTKNVVFTIVPQTTNVVDISDIRFVDNTIKVEYSNPGNKEIVRIGEYGNTTVPIKNVVARGNTIIGDLVDSPVMSVLGGANEVVLRDNYIKNTGLKGTSYGIKVDTGVSNITGNTIINVNTGITKTQTSISENNTVDGVLNGNAISHQNLGANGYIRFGNTLVQQWMTCTVTAISGAEQSFEVPFGWPSGEVYNISNSIQSTGGAFSGKPVTITTSGTSTIKITNPNAETLTVKVFIVSTRP